jgi:signal transduction histidine kinase
VVGMEERAALLGGRLEMRTAQGKGTTVIVQLPVSPPIERQM